MTPAQPATVPIDHKGPKDIERLVQAIVSAAEESGRRRQRAPWLPPLPSLVPLESLPTGPDANCPVDGPAPVGVLDEPHLQRQRVHAVDLERDGNLLVYGTGRSGKTVLLRTLAASLASRAAPAELHLYGLDFGTRGLAALEALPHCGGVIVPEEEERVGRLLAHLQRARADRRRRFAAAGTATLSEYRSVTSRDHRLPRIVVLVDNFGGFASAYERVNLGQPVRDLIELVSDGGPLGIHFVLTADRRGAVPGPLSSVVSSRIVLRMANDDEYVALDVPQARGMELSSGRGFVNDIELQCAIVGTDTSGAGQAAAITSLAGQLRSRYGTSTAPVVGVLPLNIPRGQLPAPAAPLTAVAGLRYDDLEPALVDLTEGHFLVIGPRRSGRTTALGTLATSVSTGTPEARLHLIAPRRSAMSSMTIWATTALGRECGPAVGDLARRLEAETAGGHSGPDIVVVDDGDDLPPAAMEALEVILALGRDGDVRVLSAGREPIRTTGLRRLAQRDASGEVRAAAGPGSRRRRRPARRTPPSNNADLSTGTGVRREQRFDLTHPGGRVTQTMLSGCW